MDDLINKIKALSDKTRLRIMLVLIQAKRELCICEIMDTLSIPQYNVSRHARELRMAGLVRERKEGRFVLYELCAPKGASHEFLLKAIESFDKNVLAEDNKRLKKRLALRVNGKCVIGIKQGCC